MLKIVTTVALTTLLTTTNAHAEPKDERTAVELAVAGELASLGLLGVVALTDSPPELAMLGVAGLASAPSFGHWYAGHHLTRGMVTRAAGAGVMTLGVMQAFDSFSNRGDGGSAADALIIIGAAAFVVGTVDDFITTPGAVRRHNARALRVVPTATSESAGLGLAGTF